jgi:hypothetical protein
MKLLVVAGNGSTKDILRHHFEPQGFEFIVYHNPLKAMDNIDEIAPDIIIFSAKDFPRHWKPFLKVLRSSLNREQSIFIILTHLDFSFEEAAKAMHLGVNGMMVDDFHESKDLQKLERLFTRYSKISDNRKIERYFPEDDDLLEFMFTHPRSGKIITGIINDINLDGVNFIPDSPQLTSDIMAGEDLSICTLGIKDDAFELKCDVLRNTGRLVLRFTEFDEAVYSALMEFMYESSKRELDRLLSNS